MTIFALCVIAAVLLLIAPKSKFSTGAGFAVLAVAFADALSGLF